MRYILDLSVKVRNKLPLTLVIADLLHQKTRKKEPVERTLRVLEMAETLVTLEPFAKGQAEVVSNPKGNLRAVRILAVVDSSEMIGSEPLNVELLRKRMLDPALKSLLENPDGNSQMEWELPLKDDAVRRF